MSCNNENSQSNNSSESVCGKYMGRDTETSPANKSSAISVPQITALLADPDVKVLELKELEEYIRKAQEYLLDLQTPEGSWKGKNTSGPLDTAQALIFERYLGILNQEDASEGTKWLQGQQREDGSFPPYPFAHEGDFDATCYAYAGMLAAGASESDLAIQRAWQIIEAEGGFAKARVDTQIFLAMAGLLEPSNLPSSLLLHKLIPGFERLMIKFLGLWVVLAFNQTLPLVRGLKDRGNPPNWFKKPIKNIAARRVVSYLTHRQNPNGDWCGIGFNTMMGAACLYSLGIPLTDSRIQKALSYINRLKVYSPQGMYVLNWTSEIWDTGCTVLALVESGVTPNNPHLERAARYLISQQSWLPVPRDWQNPKLGCPRSGGWGFGEGNQLGIDTDSTATALAALKSIALGYPTLAIRKAIEKGLAWKLGMQNSDGGWGAWTHGHASKKPGPMYPHSLAQRLHYPLILSDPSTEGLTGRVLYALGRNGYSKEDPEVQKAIAFLKVQQTENGAWWGRWFVNYLMDTSYILCGLKAVGEDMNEPYIKGAVKWLKTRQNEDGGWGEGVESYEDPRLAGIGKSIPTITGLVVSALIDAGEEDSEEIKQGVNYLVRQQRREGTWEELQVQATAFPSIKLYYYNEFCSKHLPLYALGKYRTVLSSRRLNK